MEKLELKHLAAYLPYGLKVQHTEFLPNKDEIQTTLIESISDNCVTFTEYCCDYYFNEIEPECKIKPILRPLSDLTKEIEVNGEKFMPMEKLYKHWVGTHTNNQINQKYFSEIMERLSKYDDCKHIHYCIVENLFKWHFDIFELIHKNLAIDINTLKL